MRSFCCRQFITEVVILVGISYAGNQGNHQNFDPFLLPYQFWLIFIGMKQKKKLWKITNKMADSKNQMSTLNFFCVRTPFWIFFWIFLNFFFASFQSKSGKIYNLARMGQNFDDYHDFQLTIRGAYNFATQCTPEWFF